MASTQCPRSVRTPDVSSKILAKPLPRAFTVNVTARGSTEMELSFAGLRAPPYNTTQSQLLRTVRSPLMEASSCHLPRAPRSDDSASSIVIIVLRPP